MYISNPNPNPNSIPLHPSDPSESNAVSFLSVNANACRLDRVDIEDIRDIMFACRFVPLIQSAISILQGYSYSTANSPIYRQLCSGLHSLSKWTLLKEDIETSLPEYLPLSERSDHTSSQKGSTNSSKSSDTSITSDSDDEEDGIEARARDNRARTMTISDTPLPKANRSIKHHHGKQTNRDVVDAISRVKIKKRQGILADCRLLEMSLHFADIVFILVREHDKSGDDDYPIEPGHSKEKKRRKKKKCKGKSVPHLLVDCCLLVHNVIRASISLNNQKNALKIMSIHGKRRQWF
jgi:hypothetical protein